MHVQALLMQRETLLRQNAMLYQVQMQALAYRRTSCMQCSSSDLSPSVFLNQEVMGSQAASKPGRISETSTATGSTGQSCSDEPLTTVI